MKAGQPSASRSLPHELRKTVTVLFSDVTGSTALGEELDPEALRAVMTRYFDEMRTAIEYHGGTVEKFVGDEVMAVFGVPEAHEDDALRAVRAAVHMRYALAALNEQLEQERGLRLEVRTSVNTGLVVAGDASAGHGFVSGDAVNVGKRLEQATTPGEILIGASTFRLVREAVEAELLEPLPLKGKSEPVPAFRLRRVLEGVPGFARHFEAPLVGRAAELAQLRQAFAAALRERRCRLVTVLGEAGIGKTRLANELVASLQDDAQVLVGRCVSYGDGATYLPLGEVVRQAGGDDVEAELTRLLGGDAEAKRLAERLAGAVGLAATTAAGEEIALAVRRFLEALARSRPLLLIFEDIHWAEPTFLDLLEYLRGWTEDSPVLLLCLSRPELLDERPAWISGKESASIVLGPLTQGDSQILLANLQVELQEEEEGSRLAEVAEGNPLFLEQLLAFVHEDGGLVSMPPTLEALLAARLDRLPASERAVLERAAVVGREFWRGSVLALSPEEERPSVSRQLLSLVRSELVHPERSALPSEDAFRFHHVLIRDAAYAGIPKALRAELHERCADWLERTSGEFDELVGHHLEQAYGYRAELGAVDERARELADRAHERLAAAGRRARDRMDIPATINLLERAIALAPDSDSRRLELMLDLSGALYWSGDLERKEKLLGEVLDEAVAVGDERLELHARLRYQSSRRAADTESLVEESRRTAELAIPLFEKLEDNRGLAIAWDALGLCEWSSGRVAVATDAFERALTHARQAGDLFMDAELTNRVINSIVDGPMPVPECIRRGEAFLAHGKERPTVQLATLGSVALLQAMQRRFDEARATYARARAIALSLGFKTGIANGAFAEAMIESLAGDPDAAERKLRRGYETLERLGETASRAGQAASLAEVLYMQGRYEEAERFVAISEEIAPSDFSDLLNWLRSIKAKLLARDGDVVAAERLAREAVSAVEQRDAVNDHADRLMDLAEVLHIGRNESEAASATVRALKLYELKGNLAMATRARALLADLTA